MLFEQTGIVLGNHPNRIGFDFQHFKGPLYGCNAIYRDLSPKELFIIDEEMYAEASENYKGSIRFCRRGIPDFGTPSSEIFCCSGIAAIWGMTQLEQVGSIYLIGWSPWNTPKRQNIYDGTKCYPSGEQNIQPGLAPWVDQFVRMFGNSKTKFSILGEDLPNSLSELKNFKIFCKDEIRDEIRNLQ